MYPQVTPELRDQLAHERRRLVAMPELAMPPADLSRDERYLFRTRPGTHRGLLFALPLPPEEAAFNDNTVKYQFEKRRWTRLVARPMFPDLDRDAAFEKASELLEDIRDRLGDAVIRFTQVGRAQECVFGTDDEVVAAYVRGLITSGKPPFDRVYEESGKARVVVGSGKDAKAFPNTNAGWNAARNYASTNNIEDIKLVKE